MASKITARLITESSITIMMNGKTYILTEDNHQHYTALRTALAAEDVETIDRLIDVPKAVNNYGAGVITVSDGTVFFEGKPLHNAVTTRLLRQMDEGFDVKPMIAFLTNLMKNPSMVARNELYLWLEENQCPITEDGHFIAFKNVRDTYKDWHSNSIDNSVGQKPSMPRNEVDDDRNQTCSAGLHFCSESYLQHFHAGPGTRTMVLKVNPADVVSIPNDYNNAKGRTWQYEVIGEVDPANIKSYYDTPVHGAKPTFTQPAPQTEAEDEYYDEDDTFEVRSSDDGFDWDDNYEGEYATKQGAIDAAKAIHDEHGVSVIVVDVYGEEVYELKANEEAEFDFDPNQEDEGIVHETSDEPPSLDEVMAVPFPEAADPVKPVVAVAQATASDEDAPLLSEMLFTKTQAAAILNVNIETLDALLESGAKVERVARGGKNWVRIK